MSNFLCVRAERCGKVRDGRCNGRHDPKRDVCRRFGLVHRRETLTHCACGAKLVPVCTAVLRDVGLLDLRPSRRSSTRRPARGTRHSQ